jgi:hypothetical protein
MTTGRSSCFGNAGGVSDLVILAMPRRFPPPWSVERSEACFIVRDHGGRGLAYVYFEEEPGRRAAAHL